MQGDPNSDGCFTRAILKSQLYNLYLLLLLLLYNIYYRNRSMNGVTAASITCSVVLVYGAGDKRKLSCVYFI